MSSESEESYVKFGVCMDLVMNGDETLYNPTHGDKIMCTKCKKGPLFSCFGSGEHNICWYCRDWVIKKVVDYKLIVKHGIKYEPSAYNDIYCSWCEIGPLIVCHGLRENNLCEPCMDEISDVLQEYFEDIQEYLEAQEDDE